MNMLKNLAISRSLCYLWSLDDCCLSSGTTLEASWIWWQVYFCISHFWAFNQFYLYIPVPWQITCIRTFTDTRDQKPYGNPTRLYQACISCPYVLWLFPRTLVAYESWFSGVNFCSICSVCACVLKFSLLFLAVLQ